MAGRLASSVARSVAPAAIGVILTSLAVGCQSRTPEELRELTAVLAEKTLGRQTTAPSEVRTAVRKFYELRATTCAWTAKRPIRSADDALTVLASAEAHGLEREDYGYAGLVAARNRLRENPPKGDAGLQELARFDVRLTTSLVALGHDVAVGRTRPPEWRSQRKSPDLAKTLFDAREGRLSSWLIPFARSTTSTPDCRERSPIYAVWRRKADGQTSRALSVDAPRGPSEMPFGAGCRRAAISRWVRQLRTRFDRSRAITACHQPGTSIDRPSRR